MNKKLFLFSSLFCICLIALSGSVLAQGTTSRVTGTVTDNLGAAVSGATVTLTNEGTGVSQTTETTDSGTYTFDLIQPGTYTVAVERQGFKRYVSTGNPALVNQPATVNVAMEVGGVAETVTVQATAEQVQTSTSGNVGSTIEQRTLESLPIVGARGRNPLDLLNYQPGIVSGANTGGGVHVHGSRDRSFNFTLDGIDINESTAGGSNFTPLRPNPDSIQEFQVVTSNFTAELGRSSGAQVTFVTRSGTNKLRGSLFEFYQTPELIANTYANNTLLPGFSKPQFVQHIFGGSLGGPLINPGFGEGNDTFKVLRDKAFFFINLQVLRQSQQQLVQRTVYTQQARQGIFRYVQGGRNAAFGQAVTSAFTTGASVTASGAPVFQTCGPGVSNPCIASYNVGNNPSGIGIDPVILAAINLAPLPNDFTRGDGLNTAGFNFLAPTQEKQYDFVSKFDFNINDTNQFYIRYAQGEQNTFNDSGNSGLQPFPTVPGIVDTFRKPRNLAVNYRTSPTSSVTNEFIYGYSTFSFFFGTENTNIQPFILNLPTDAGTNVRGNGRSATTHQFIDNLTYVRGSHTFKTGINFRLGSGTDDRSEVAGGRIEGFVNFSAATNSNFNAFNLPTSGGTSINTNDLTRLRSQINDYLGRVGTYNQAFVATPDGSAFAPAGTRWLFEASYPEYDFYIQDTWKVRPNLTIDLGLRWEPKFAPTSKGDLPILVPNQPLGLDAPPSNNVRWVEGNLFDTAWNNLGPSVGFAWDPFSKGKTSIRANYRLAYDRIATFLFSSFIFQNAPGNNVLFPSTNTFGSGGGLYRNLPVLVPTQTPNDLRQPGAFGTNTQNIIDPNLEFPKIHQWFAGFQQEIWGGNVLEINYIGKKGSKLFGGYDANQVNIRATDPRFGNETFLQAFNTVKNGSESPLFNALFANHPSRLGTETGSAFVRRNFESTLRLNSVAGLAASAATQLAVGNTQSLLAAGGFNQFFLQKYPQFGGALNIIDNGDRSMYNALEIILKRRFSQGVSFQIGYTLAKSMDTRSFDPAFTTVGRGNTQIAANSPYDINNRELNYALSDFDRRQSLQATYVAELPFGRGRWLGSEMPKALDLIIGGWQLAGAVRWQSGRPFTVVSESSSLTNVIVTPANCNGCSPNMGRLIQNLGTNYYFTAEQQALFSNPAAGEFSNTGRNYFIGPTFFQMDASLSKTFRFTERYKFEIRLEGQNVTNTPSFAAPNTVLEGTAPFGRIRESVVSIPRRLQIGAKFSF